MPSTSIILGNSVLSPTRGQAVRSRSEIRLVGTRALRVLVVMETKHVIGAGFLRPFAAVAQVDHGGGPRGGEGARILDGEVDLEELILVVGIDRPCRAP